MTELKRTELKVGSEKAILIGVILPDSNADPRDPLGELHSLATTAGATPVAQLLQRKQKPDAATFCGSGKAEEIADLAIKHKADVVLFDNDLSPAQIGKLEKIINTRAKSPTFKGIKVLDRSELILDIFAARARTAESRLQVELAQLQYTYPRLTRMWGHLERIASGSSAGMGLGTRGPGETQLEVDRRLVRDRVSALQAEIVHIQERKTREVQSRNMRHFTVCVVGYTNAGKSTLFNTLTGAGTYADDKLFATLDTKTRLWQLSKSQRVMLSDTVGFVRDLPHHLVASFKATLEEAAHADLLLHVLDVGHPRARQQAQAVREVLADLGYSGKPELLLLNKTDTPEGQDAMPEWRALHPQAIAISARTGAGLDRLHAAVGAIVSGEEIRLTATCNAGDGKLLARLEELAHVISRSYEGDTAVLELAVPKRLLPHVQSIPGLTLHEHTHPDVHTLAEAAPLKASIV